MLDLDWRNPSPDRLSSEDWVLVEPFCVEAGADCTVIASIAAEKPQRVTVTNGAGRPIGNILIRGRKLPVNADFSENGVPDFPKTTLSIPSEMPGGMYFIDDKWAFLVSRQHAPYKVVIPVSTMQAFNKWAGRSLYSELTTNRDVYRYSLRRPLAKAYATDRLGGFLQWAAGGTLDLRDISFISDIDLARPGVLDHAELLFIVGRSEYWTRASRLAFDRYVERGGDVILLSSETMYYEIRQEEAHILEWRKRGSANDPRHPASGAWSEPERGYPLIPSIGPNPLDGGWYQGAEQAHPEWGAYTIGQESKLATNLHLARGDKIPLATVFYDGLPVRDYVDGIPVLDPAVLPFHKYTLIGFSYGYDTPKHRIGAWFGFQRTSKSGRCIHFGSYSWAMESGLGSPGITAKAPDQIVMRAVEILRARTDIF